jgi:predicted nuclease of predicted toxin-antitoxin system
VRFLIDNALSPELARLLSSAGHEALHVRDYGLATAEDADILQRAETEDRIVVSADSDFGMLLAVLRGTKPSFIRVESLKPLPLRVMLVVVFLDLLRFGDFLVLHILARGVFAAGSLNVRLADRFRTDGETGDQLFQVLRLARRAGCDGVLQDQEFKFVAALTATVVVDGHRAIGIVTNFERRFPWGAAFRPRLALAKQS